MTIMRKAAVTTAALAMFAVGGAAVADSASARSNQGGSGNKSCTGPDGTEYTHGSIFVSYIKVGTKLKTAYVYKCNNGTWESVTI